MADFTFNIALGRVVQYYQNVEDNSPAGCEIVIVPISTAVADDTLRDYDNLSLLIGDAGVTDLTGTGGWTRKDLVAADVSINVDDVNNRVDIDIPDQTWTAITANATDLVFCYDPTGSAADTSLIPLTLHDFPVTQDGSDVTAVINTAGVFRAS